MKPYKRISAVDSDRIIVFDDNMKEMSFTRLGLSAVSIVILLFLTTYGCAVGLNTEIVSNKLESIDVWASHPANQPLIFFFCVGVVGVFCLTMALYWVYKMLSK